MPLVIILAIALSGCATQGATSAEEYFSLGMAYFDLGQGAKDAGNRERYFKEAEKWLVRAKAIDKTRNASEYNMGRIAFESGRYEEAAKRFESVLKRDPENVLALKAAAYTRIKTGELELAQRHYAKLLELVPESADGGYNHALVLYAMKKYAEAEQVLGSRQYALLDNADALILYARSQKEQGKVEAIDSYAKWLAGNSGAKERYEYAQLLEGQELYARALEEYRSALSGLAEGSADPRKYDLRFALAKLLLIADSENAEGVTELQAAVDEGFSDIDALEKLAADERISAENKTGIKTIISGKQQKQEAAEKESETPQS